MMCFDAAACLLDSHKLQKPGVLRLSPQDMRILYGFTISTRTIRPWPQLSATSLSFSTRGKLI
jgi:hypothetical protein